LQKEKLVIRILFMNLFGYFCVRYIEENYSKIRDVERELGNLTFEMKLTAGPKKAGWYVCFRIVVFTLVYSNFADFDVGFVDGGVWMKLST
jgi:hypothetical protein